MSFLGEPAFWAIFCLFALAEAFAGAMVYWVGRRREHRRARAGYERLFDRFRRGVRFLLKPETPGLRHDRRVIGARIRSRRKAMRLSCANVASSIGVSSDWLVLVEEGAMPLVDEDIVDALERELHLQEGSLRKAADEAWRWGS